MPPQNNLEQYLQNANVPTAVKADAWDVFHGSKSQADFEKGLRGLQMPDNVRADLWDMRAKQGWQTPTPSAPPPNRGLLDGMGTASGEKAAQNVETMMTAGGRVPTAAGPFGAAIPGFARLLGGLFGFKDAQTRPEKYQAATEAVRGAGQLANVPMLVGGAAAPAALATGIATSTLSGKGAEKVTKMAGGSPDAQQFAGEVGGWLPMLLGPAAAMFKRAPRVVEDVAPKPVESVAKPIPPSQKPPTEAPPPLELKAQPTQLPLPLDNVARTAKIIPGFEEQPDARELAEADVANNAKQAEMLQEFVERRQEQVPVPLNRRKLPLSEEAKAAFWDHVKGKNEGFSKGINAAPPTPAPQESAINAEPPRLEAIAAPPSVVGSAEAAAADTAHFQAAREILGPNASLSDIATKAQELKSVQNSNTFVTPKVSTNLSLEASPSTEPASQEASVKAPNVPLNTEATLSTRERYEALRLELAKIESELRQGKKQAALGNVKEKTEEKFAPRGSLTQKELEWREQRSEYLRNEMDKVFAQHVRTLDPEAAQKLHDSLRGQETDIRSGADSITKMVKEDQLATALRIALRQETLSKEQREGIHKVLGDVYDTGEPSIARLTFAKSKRALALVQEAHSHIAKELMKVGVTQEHLDRYAPDLARDNPKGFGKAVRGLQAELPPGTNVKSVARSMQMLVNKTPVVLKYPRYKGLAEGRLSELDLRTARKVASAIKGGGRGLDKLVQFTPDQQEQYENLRSTNPDAATQMKKAAVRDQFLAMRDKMLARAADIGHKADVVAQAHGLEEKANKQALDDLIHKRIRMGDKVSDTGEYVLSDRRLQSLVNSPRTMGSVFGDAETVAKAKGRFETELARRAAERNSAEAARMNTIKQTVNPPAAKPVERPALPEKTGPSNTLFSGASIFSPKVVRAIFPKVADFFETKGPTDRDIAAQIVREHTGEAARAKAQLFDALREESKRWVGASNSDLSRFTDAVESGNLNGLSKEDTKLVGTLRQILDSRRDDIRALGTGKLEKFYENYFPHIWEHPTRARDIISSVLQGRRPLQGSANFLKQRSISTISAGIAEGLKPVTNNPVELVLLKAHEMDRYLMAHRIFGAYKDAGLLQFVKLGQLGPDGFTKINDTLFRSLVPTKSGMVLRGEWYAPEGAAKILNNYLSPGLRGNPLYDLFRATSNTLNQVQLGFSAFHLGFTTLDSQVSDLALGIEQMSRGQVLKGGVRAGKAIVPALSAIHNFVIGRGVEAEYLKPGSAAKYAETAALVPKAGGRVAIDPMYVNDNAKKFLEAFHRSDWAEVGKQVLPAVMETAAKPIMSTVSSIKLGVFHGFASDIMERARNEGWDEFKIGQEVQKAWDSVDNRMGQMVYDNLFWNRAAKDLGMVSVRSLGWNLGTLREVAGGGKDFGAQFLKAATGNKTELTHRMAYLMALPAVVGMYGAMLNYAHTGEAPQELKDYFFPRTGRLNAAGDPERLSLPSYMKDIYAWKHAPTEVAVHKLNPGVAMIADLIRNQDFYGNEIRHPEDEKVQQIVDVAKWAMTQATPFNIQGIVQRMQSAGTGNPFDPKTLAGTIESQVGVTPAPSYVDRSAAAEMARDYAQRMESKGPFTKEQSAHIARLREFENLRRTGQLTDDALYQAVQKGEVTGAEADTIGDIANKQPRFLQDFKRLSLPEALRVWQAMTPAEKEATRDLLADKEPQLQNYLPADQERMGEQLDRAFNPVEEAPKKSSGVL